MEHYNENVDNLISRPTTPQTAMANDVSSHHETAF